MNYLCQRGFLWNPQPSFLNRVQESFLAPGRYRVFSLWLLGLVAHLSHLLSKIYKSSQSRVLMAFVVNCSGTDKYLIVQKLLQQQPLVLRTVNSSWKAKTYSTFIHLTNLNSVTLPHHSQHFLHPFTPQYLANPSSKTVCPPKMKTQRKQHSGSPGCSLPF